MGNDFTKYFASDSKFLVFPQSVKRKKIREIDSLVTSLVKPLISRENVDFSVKFVITFYSTFPHCLEVPSFVFSRNIFQVQY